jgi:hypothetical protein
MAHSHRIAAWLPNLRKLRETVDSLERAGFDRSQFGVLGRKSLFDKPQREDLNVRTAASQIGVRNREGAGAFRNILVDGLGFTGAIVAASSIVLAGGGLGVALLATAATAATGGLLGALLAHGFEADFAGTLNRKINNGGLLLWIDARNGNQTMLARNGLANAGADIAYATAPGAAIAA